MVSSGRADAFKESELLPEFLGDIFCGLLGYSSAVEGKDRYTFGREKHVQVDGKFADAVLGDFRPELQRFVVAIEGKGPKDPLDRPFGGRKMSAVDQAYRYAINLPCDWIVVTSIRETRLYYKGADQFTFERFETADLAGDDALLRKFVFLLGADRVVPRTEPCHLYELLDASEKVGREVTKDYYVRYADMREAALDRLCEVNPEVPPLEVLACTQKILDRVLFTAFCEDRGLLPGESIGRAYQHADPYNPRPIWDNFRGLFRAIDQGNAALRIPAYNGGLFAEDPRLDALTVPDEVCEYFRDLAAYEYRPASEVGDGEDTLVDVDILGHIFEQSITDLERLKNEIEGREDRQSREQHTSRRKREGAFYTPPFITRYIVGQALGRVLEDRFEALRDRHAGEAAGTARKVLADPRAYDLDVLNTPQREALIRFWEAWQDDLATIRVLDPSCGSGAFLIEAFEQLYQAFERSNDRLEELRGDRTLFDLDRQILQNNLYGVDLNEEAIQICKLSLWIKTAQRGKVLTSLDHSIRVGNSVVSDPAVHPRAFDWHSAFPEVFEGGGFDVVVGNPPYVRQEWISPYKPYLKEHFASYHGMADLYVYFYELGMNLLRPGGRLSYVVTNKWLRAGYAEPLRTFFAERSWVEDVVDFGHAKQIFPDADVFPCIIVARRPDDGPAPETATVCAIPRDQLRIADLGAQIGSEGIEVGRGRLAAGAWSLEPKGVHELMGKIRGQGVPLAEFAGGRPYRGILTGLNEAFLIDTPTRDALIAEDPQSAELIRPFLRGQDISQWSPTWADLWMIVIKSSGDHAWPWTGEGERAEEVFGHTYPSLYAHLKPLEAKLIKRQDKGRHWWELRTCAYWASFEKPKIVYPDITWRSSFSYDQTGTLIGDTSFFIATTDTWILACLNSPLIWWYAWRTVYHGKDEALRMKGVFMNAFPIAVPTREIASRAEEATRRLIEVTTSVHRTSRDILNWLRSEYDIEKPSMKLRQPVGLEREVLATEVKKLRGRDKPLSLAARKLLDEEYERTIVPARGLAAEARVLERQVADLVNEAYGLTPEEIALMWETAPPRMPAVPHSVEPVA
ncbi:DNA methyltransferase [Tautonia sp. JC769]|uniref:Eco57I restriction-modification methylase domain-containing protein n=1 Tax=Tautonia sp. JC769 TaxID=3232135 RepID=UPI003458DBEA